MSKFQFSSIRPIDVTLSGATTQSQNRLGSDGNEGVFSCGVQILDSNQQDQPISSSLKGEAYKAM